VAFKLYYVGKWDFRRLNRDWRAVYRASPDFAGLDRQVRQDGNAAALLVMGDLAEEHGFTVLAKVLRTAVKPGKPRRRRRGRRLS
jgi:hypothetical protein